MNTYAHIDRKQNLLKKVEIIKSKNHNQGSWDFIPRSWKGNRKTYIKDIKKEEERKDSKETAVIETHDVLTPKKEIKQLEEGGMYEERKGIKERGERK